FLRPVRSEMTRPSPSPAPRERVNQGLLPQRREGGRDDELVLLLDELTPGVRRPGAGGTSLVTDAETFGCVLIGPDMDPLVERAELGMTGGGQRRKLDPPLDSLGPALDDRRHRLGKHRVSPDLVEIAMLPQRE